MAENDNAPATDESGDVIEVVATVDFTDPLIFGTSAVELLKELEREVKNKEIISGQINAKPRMAKSTIAILLGKFIFALLKKYNYKEADKEFSMDNMARDQGERAKKMREPQRMHDIIITDENNALEDTGENATVECAIS